MCDKWAYTGRVCFACGGTGKRSRAKVVKVFTDEYWEKLQSRRKARAEKYAEEHAEEIAQAQAKAREWHKKELEFRFAEYGCDKDGIGYVLTGKTYAIKDQIKNAGGKWLFGLWICPVKIEAKNVNAARIDISHSFDDNDSETPYEVIMNTTEGR